MSWCHVMTLSSRPVVLLTDYAWPDFELERRILEEASFRLHVVSKEPADAETTARHVREQQAAAILTCWARVSAQAMAASTQLRIVARLGVGLDNINVAAATDRGVWVTNVPDYCIEEVSDHALGMVLAWTRGLLTLDAQVRAGVWAPSGARLRRLANLTCGIVGYGRIGRRTAEKLSQGFGARVLACTPIPPATDPFVEFVKLEALLARSDVVILHAPLTEQTRHLIDRQTLAQMRPGALLVNVSRGGLVDSEAVAEALNSGHLGGAAHGRRVALLPARLCSGHPRRFARLEVLCH